MFIVFMLTVSACSSTTTRTDEHVYQTSQRMATWCEANGLIPMDPVETFDFYDDRGHVTGSPRATSSTTANILDDSWYLGGGSETGESFVGPNSDIWAWGAPDNFSGFDYMPNGTVIADGSTRYYPVSGRWVVTSGQVTSFKQLIFNNFQRATRNCNLENGQYYGTAHCGFISGNASSPGGGNTRILLQAYAQGPAFFPSGAGVNSGYWNHIGWTTGRVKVTFKQVADYPQTNAGKGITLFAHYRTEDDLYAATWRQYEDYATLKGKFCTQLGRGNPQDSYTNTLHVPAPHMNPNQLHTIELRVNETRLQFWINGTIIFDHDYTNLFDDAPLNIPGIQHAWGTFGIRTDDISLYIDDITSDDVGPL